VGSVSALRKALAECDPNALQRGVPNARRDARRWRGYGRRRGGHGWCMVAIVGADTGGVEPEAICEIAGALGRGPWVGGTEPIP
jgi:hypothetical protein